MWFCSVPYWLNARSHTVHLCGFSPEWMRRCAARLLDVENRCLQIGHSYAFSPLCAFMCSRRCSDRPNILPHSEHWYGFSPEWIRLCRARCPTRENRLSQMTHTKGRSPVWLRLCIASADELPKHFPHSVHKCFILLAVAESCGCVCAVTCRCSRPSVTNRLLQTEHSYGLIPLCVFAWMIKFARHVNRFSHVMHMYGRGLPSVWLAPSASASAQYFPAHSHVQNTVSAKKSYVCKPRFIANGSSSC